MKYYIKEVKEAFKIADTKMKESNGHSYFEMLQVRCKYCGRSPKQKGMCKYWHQTLYHNVIRHLLDKAKKKKVVKEA